MGEKGNVTSEELAATAAGGGAVIAGSGTQVTAVFEDVGNTLRDKVIDKGADAGIAAGTERWKARRRGDTEDTEQSPPEG